MTDRETLPTLVDEMWEENILPKLTEFLGIPSKSPNFDADWLQNGYLLQVVQLVADWCEQRDIPGLSTEILILKDQKGKDRTPLLFIEIPASEHGNQEETFLFYNHLDKQPECPGWSEGLEPFKGVRKGDKLYGRGAVDDGYAIFTKIAAIEALHKTGGSYPRCVGVVETSEESCSPDLPFYLDMLSERIGTPSVVFVFDTMSGNYEQLWVTMSLRSILYANLRVDVLKEPSIIANANGIVPSSFRIMRQLLSRVEDEETGLLKPDFCQAEIPAERRSQISHIAADLGDEVFDNFVFADGVQPTTDDPEQALLSCYWEPLLATVAQDGLKPLDNAALLLRTHTTLSLSFRLPPTADVYKMDEQLGALLTSKPPYNAKVSFEPYMHAQGWNAQPIAPWFEQAINNASLTHFGNKAKFWGSGGAIPVVSMLAESYPQAQFMVSGLVGPGANAHGPDEFLHIPAAKKLTCCLASIIDDHSHEVRQET